MPRRQRQSCLRSSCSVPALLALLLLGCALFGIERGELKFRLDLSQPWANGSQLFAGSGSLATPAAATTAAAAAATTAAVATTTTAPTTTAPPDAGPRAAVARVARARAGLYVDKAAHKEFANTLLLTGANGGYLSFYDNWKCFADRHGLDWAVIANDDKSYQQLGPERAMPVLGDKVTAMVGWGNVRLDTIGRNKMFMVLQIMNMTGLDVLFSDADNVFHSDPFRPGVSIGDLIRKQRYDYIYEEELAKAPKTDHVAPGDGGNTGFFYASGSRKPHRIQALFRAVVDRVDKIRSLHNNSGADQPIFWDVMNELRQSKGNKEAKLGFRCAKMCGQQPTCKASAEETIEYCAMNPFEHPTGWEEPPMTLVSYHANYATNTDKIKKLKKAKLWLEVDPSTKECVKGK